MEFPKQSFEYSITERKSVMDNSRVIEEITPDKVDSRPEKFNLNRPYVNITCPCLIAGAVDSYNNFFDAIKNGYFEFLYEDGSILLEGNPLPRSFFGDELVHVMEYENYQITDEDDFVGNNNDEGAVFLQTSDTLVMPNFECYRKGKVIARLVIDVDCLFDSNRKLYIDEESITETPDEYKKSFFMYGGMPRTAIKKVQIIVMGDVELDINSPDLVYDSGKEMQREREYNRRLMSTEDKLKTMAMSV